MQCRDKTTRRNKISSNKQNTELNTQKQYSYQNWATHVFVCVVSKDSMENTFYLPTHINVKLELMLGFNTNGTYAP